MKTVVLTDPQVFVERAKPLLMDEPRSNLILGIVRGMIADPRRFEDAEFFLVEQDDRPVAAGLITPPHHLALSDATDSEAIRALARFVLRERPHIPGATGERSVVETFTKVWEELTGSTVTLEMAQGIFSLETVNAVRVANGGPRQAGMDDLQLLVAWLKEFEAEAIPGITDEADRIEMFTRRRLDGAAGAGIWLWENSRTPVAMSGYSGPTGSGIRINGVYTPPEQRGKGFATALVAHQSQWLLNRGYRSCFLYSDLANPTSNAIYRRIGYHQVAESAMYRSGAANARQVETQGAESRLVAVYHGGMANHPDIASLEFLLGTWSGNGVGIYPTIEDFSYTEEISFTAPPGKPFLHYSQKTWRAVGHPEAGTPLHTECGYIRPLEGGGAELVVAQPSGIVEVHTGSVDGSAVSFSSDLVAQTRTAKEVNSVDRRIVVDDDALRYEMWMGAVGQPHQLHLEATLNRTTAS